MIRHDVKHDKDSLLGFRFTKDNLNFSQEGIGLTFFVFKNIHVIGGGWVGFLILG